jgi:integrase
MTKFARSGKASLHAGYPFGPFVRLAMMLGQRREEIAGMQWGELDLEEATWLIPSGRYKTGIEHLVPLPPQAVDLIRAIPRVDGSRFLFSTTTNTHISGFTKMKARLEQLSGTADWRIHDFRRTCRTNMSALGVDPDIAERVLGHVVAGVRGVYDRYSFLPEKRRALEAWALRLMQIVEPPPENVVPLRSAV